MRCPRNPRGWHIAEKASVRDEGVVFGTITLRDVNAKQSAQDFADQGRHGPLLAQGEVLSAAPVLQGLNETKYARLRVQLAEIAQLMEREAHGTANAHNG
jgi:hypothetical protein